MTVYRHFTWAAVLLAALAGCQHRPGPDTQTGTRPPADRHSAQITEVEASTTGSANSSDHRKLATPQHESGAVPAVAERAVRSAFSSSLPWRPVPVAPAVIAGSDQYETLYESGYRDPRVSPLSTFGLDVDTASYSNMRRYIQRGQLPPSDALRMEELINYFDYPLPAVDGEHPLAVHTELGAAPWRPGHQLAMVQVKTRDRASDDARPNRFVFLVDTSGSMAGEDRLPLLKKAFLELTERLDGDDRIAIVSYAGQAGVVLPTVSGNDKAAIYRALQSLQSGGGTAGADGIATAYHIARAQFEASSNNRVILATDGDFNVGPHSTGELVKLIEQQRDQGIFLTVLGFGQGNLGDGRMNRLAGHGDGNYYYIDSELEARRVLVDKLQRSLTTVAKDVKLQIEFNPEQVAAYRLLGYQTRRLAPEDFNNDQKDAGDLGAGQVVTALYEIEPGRATGEVPSLRYQPTRRSTSVGRDELMWVSLRYRPATGGASRQIESVLKGADQSSAANMHWAATVAELGLLLKNSDYRGSANFSALIRRAETLLNSGAESVAEDPLRREFVSLARQAELLYQQRAARHRQTTPCCDA